MILSETFVLNKSPGIIGFGKQLNIFNYSFENRIYFNLSNSYILLIINATSNFYEHFSFAYLIYYLTFLLQQNDTKNKSIIPKFNCFLDCIKYF